MTGLRPALTRLEREQAQDLRRSVLCGELSWDRQVVADGLDEAAWLLLAWEGGKPVGTLRLAEREGRHWAEQLAVLPAFRRRGLGTALLVEAAAEAARRGAPALSLLAPEVLQPWFLGRGYRLELAHEGVCLLSKPLL